MRAPIDNFKLTYYPNGSITQFFAENPALYAFLNLDGHNGIDIVAPWGTPIKAVTKQRVVEVRDSPDGYGKHVKCIDDKFEYTYGHLSSINCKVGDVLEKGQVLGKMGNTGFVVSGATPFWEYNPWKGTHLHFGMRRFKKWISGQWNITYTTGDKGTILNYDNGFKGAIDPAPFLTDTTEEIKQLQLTVVSLANKVISLYNELIGRLLTKKK